MMLYLSITAWFSSTSILATLSWSPISPAISSRTGAMRLHGPHQVAQKSVKTGLSDFKTSLSNVASVTGTGLAMLNSSTPQRGPSS